MLNDKPFDEWLKEKKPVILALAKRIGRKAPPVIEMGPESWLILLAGELSDCLQEVLELSLEAEQYWLQSLAKKSEEITDLETKAFGKQASKQKTLLDFCKNIDSSERRVYNYLEAMKKTIDTRSSLTQSALRFYRNV